MDRIRVMLVEDDNFTRSLIAGALQIQGIDVVCETASVGPAMKLSDELKPHVTILDLNLGAGPSGIDLALGLRRRRPSIGIVLLTTFEDPRLLGPNLPTPPNGTVYLVKKNVGEISVLYNAIQKSLAFISKDEISEFNSMYGMIEVTDSQLETMRLVAKGLSNSEVAKQRGVAEKSVEQTISRLAAKLKLPSGHDVNQRVQISKLYYKMTGSRISEDELN